MINSQYYISHHKSKYVTVLKGAASALVSRRQTRVHYQTNRDIKTWSTFFLLKSLSIPGKIQKWNKQKKALLKYCNMSDNSFRARLRELKELKLLTISKDLTITLVSFEKAAAVMGIPFTGTIKIEYDAKSTNKKNFQYNLVMDEIRCNQNKQVEALINKFNHNPQLRAIVEIILVQYGADQRQLDDPSYFQRSLLKVQQMAFKTGSENWSEIIALRADKNRSVNGIKKQYGYRSAQSVSYLKKRLKNMNIADIRKRRPIESRGRTRIYIPIK